MNEKRDQVRDNLAGCMMRGFEFTKQLDRDSRANGRVERVLTAFDAAYTHMYAPGARRHIHNAVQAGATMEENCRLFCVPGHPITMKGRKSRVDRRI